MKICVFSDSHGCPEYMLASIEQQNPNFVIFLGDGERDLQEIRYAFPLLVIEQVRGNCDRFSDAPDTLRFTVAGKRFFATHGHLYQVKMDRELTRLRYAALEYGADIALFGHTHRPFLGEFSGMKLLNPGTCGAVPSPTFGLVTIEQGTLRAELLPALS